MQDDLVLGNGLNKFAMLTNLMKEENISATISAQKAFDTTYHQFVISYLKKKDSFELGAGENPLNLKECLPGSLRQISRRR